MFDTTTFQNEMAVKYGIEKAILIYHVFNALKYGNHTDDRSMWNYKDGNHYFYTKTTLDELNDFYPFIGLEKIEKSLHELINSGVLIGYCCKEKCVLSAPQFMDWLYQMLGDDELQRDDFISMPPNGHVKWSNKQITDNSDNIGFIYFLYSHNKYKIGITTNPSNRLKTLINSNPHKTDVLLCERVYSYRELERNLHEYFKDQRYKGEWFKLAPGEDDTVLMLIKPYILHKMHNYTTTSPLMKNHGITMDDLFFNPEKRDEANNLNYQ